MTRVALSRLDGVQGTAPPADYVTLAGRRLAVAASVHVVYITL